MSPPIPVKNPPAGSRTTTVFTSGNSQAVRLPKEFRFDTSLVTIERRGDEVVLRAKRPTVGELLRGSAKLSAKDLAAWDAVDALMQDAAPHERNWDALLGADGEAP